MALSKDREELNKLYGIFNGGVYSGSEQQKANYQASEVAQNQYAQNLAKTQSTALDAIRKANASAMATGANAGLAAANQLSSVLGLQNEAQLSATDLANAYRESEAQQAQILQQNALGATQVGGELTASEATQASAESQLMAELGTSIETASTDIKSKYDALSDKDKNSDLGKAYAKAQELYTQARGSSDSAIRKDLMNQATNILQNASTVNGSKEETGTSTGTTTSTDTGDAVTFTGSETSLLSSIATISSSLDPTGRTSAESEQNTLLSLKGKYLPKNLLKSVQMGAKNALNNGTMDIDQVNEFFKKMNFKDENDKTVSYDSEYGDSCIAKGTLISLYNGREVPVEDLTDRDIVVSNDGYKDVPTRIFSIMKHPAKTVTGIKLYFSNDTDIKIIDAHSFYSVKHKKFIPISLKNVKKFIGKEFKVSSVSTATLDRYETYTETKEVYSPIAYRHIVLYTNGILSTAHLTEFIANARFNHKVKPMPYSKLPKKLKPFVSEEIFNAFDGENYPAWKGKRHIRKLLEIIYE